MTDTHVNDFKIGDRVQVEHFYSRGDSFLVIELGTVIATHDAALQIKFDEITTLEWHHYKLCEHIK